MTAFRWRDGVIEARLGAVEKALLAALPQLITQVGEVGTDPAAARLRPVVHPHDAARSAEYLSLSSDLIEGERDRDLETFAAGLTEPSGPWTLTANQAMSWVRVLTTARIILGARIGIEEDGWEQDPAVDPRDPRVAALHVLARLQDSLVRALRASL